ncbi:MarR family winged helix-turn-helix transcriptional regulator [Pediococcus acidilactici]|uniref:MarR family winged helix-turn-helix transcriptional regulator n=1 Tax=Pediococcus acidilactici TaxID=1254 RepID=UPI00155E2AC3|nr:MarR family transcriptional regulator [Pediococcus acidilactici]NRD14232.1 MarR family transcriptional regulator [Pediococcus acidilactici]
MLDKLVKKHQLAAKLFEFTALQNMADEQAERHLPVFKGQNKILVALSEGDNISQKELSQRLGISVQSIAEFIAKLLKKGYVTKQKSPTDGRVQLIKLTEKGKKEAKKSLFYIPEYLDYLNDDERAQLAAILDKMNNGIRKDLKLHGIQNIGNRIRFSQLKRHIDEDLK